MKRVFFLITFCAISSPILANFISLIQADKCQTILEVFINDKNILIKLEIGEKDYPWFSDVIPIKYFENRFIPEDQEPRRNRFMAEQFVLRANNSLLLGEVKTIEQRTRIPRSSLYTGQVDSTLLNKKIIYVEIEYAIDRKKGRAIIFNPTLTEWIQGHLG